MRLKRVGRGEETYFGEARTTLALEGRRARRKNECVAWGGFRRFEIVRRENGNVAVGIGANGNALELAA